MAGQTVVVSVLADTRRFAKGMKSLGGIAAAAGAAVGAAAVTIGVKAVKSASQLEQALGALGAVFKDQTPQMEAFAKKANQTVGLAQSEYSQLAATLGAQLKNMGVASDKLGGQTNDLITLGADLAAQFGGSTADAVAALSSLMRGERDPIEKYGVSIKQADINAKLAAMGLDGLTGAAAKTATTQATLALLFDQTADAAGAFGRESSTFAGQWQRFTATVEDISAKLGTALLPAVTAATSKLNDLASTVLNSPAFDSALQGINDFITGLLSGADATGSFGGTLGTLANAFSPVAAILEALAPVSKELGGALLELAQTLGGALKDAAGPVSELLSKIAEALVGGLVAILPSVTKLIETFTGILDDLMPAIEPLIEALGDTLAQVIESLAPVIALLVENFAEALPTITPLIPIILSLVEAVLPLVEQFAALVGTILPPLLQLFQDIGVESSPLGIQMQALGAILTVVAGIVSFFAGLWANLFETLNIFIKWISGEFTMEDVVREMLSMDGPLGDVTRWFVDLLSGIKSFVTNAVDKVKTFVSGVRSKISSAVSYFTSLPGKILAKVAAFGTLLYTAGQNLLKGLVNGITSWASRAINAALNVGRDILNGIKNFFGIASPSRVMRRMGEFITAGLAGGLEKLGKVRAATAKLSQTVTDNFAPDLTMAGPQYATGTAWGVGAASPRGGNTYNVTVQAVAPNHEVGRAVVDAIAEYERLNGARPA